MEALKSENKKRVLPTWMTAHGAEKKTTKRRRADLVPTAAARLPATRTVYCMNEAEMVDVALGILIEQGRKQEKPWEQPPLAGADKPARSPASSAPPAPRPPGTRSEDEERGGEDTPAPVPRPPPGPAGSEPARSPSPEQDHDALKYVREIFFS
ncbi:cell cycle regulator of non-homologous end joining isoform X2 [Phacochoerus africanus]|uniref:cell cycle regulator of non-homologous end joining isoform X2 n=1 Tax=Phacochoerus africanus TaxID=41426 RepID=UPI001FDAA975|nr:cell cycle regulator of non-homologous end joining isoform X2 [Phacochoerus africanus]